MKKLILYILLLCPGLYAQILPGWFHLNPATTNFLYSIYFLNSNTGFAVGTAGTILYTSNGGTNWYTRQSGSTYTLNKVVFPSAQTGYIADNSGHVLKTTNGGLNWSASYVAIVDGLYGIHFINNNVGYVVGGQNAEVKVYKTIDGGNNWVNASPSSVSGMLYAVYFATDSVGIGVGSGGLVIRTTNAGNSWSYQTIATSPIISVHFPNSTTGYISGNAIWKTTNQGLNWTLQINSTEELHSIRFLNKDTGYVVGGFGSIIKKTTNGGTIWLSQLSEPPSIFCECVFPVNKDTAYICGGYTNTGCVLKTINGGITVNIKTVSSLTPSCYLLKQNYPNPFNPSTKINFDIPKRSMITLKIYNIHGVELKTLINEFMNPGSYSADFNAADLSSGIYFYKLLTPDFAETKKMILIR